MPNEPHCPTCVCEPTPTYGREKGERWQEEWGEEPHRKPVCSCEHEWRDHRPTTRRHRRVQGHCHAVTSKPGESLDKSCPCATYEPFWYYLGYSSAEMTETEQEEDQPTPEIKSSEPRRPMQRPDWW